MSRIIALLTDFGTTDTYVGVMKGVMLGICPDAQFVDLTHAIQPQNVKQAAFALLNSYRYFPAGTIFLVVVDPGVGSERRAIAVCAGGYTFVAPDNGVLSYLLGDFDQVRAVTLDNPIYQNSELSNTFHGRDVFAPAAAHLAAGVALERFGAQVDQPVMLPLPKLELVHSHIRGEVLHVDHFGSIVTSIGLLNWGEAHQLMLNPRFSDPLNISIPAETVIVTIGKQRILGIHRAYAEVGQGEALALVGSSGYLELAINSGSFRSLIVAAIGDPVELHFEGTG